MERAKDNYKILLTEKTDTKKGETVRQNNIGRLQGKRAGDNLHVKGSGILFCRPHKAYRYSGYDRFCPPFKLP